MQDPISRARTIWRGMGLARRPLSIRPDTLKGTLVPVLKMGLFPLSFYFICFFLLTYPALLKFSTHYFTDGWDGLQHVWGIWWVEKSLTDLHRLPWHTESLYYPTGTTLLGHALSPLNGFMGTILLQFTGLLQAHNTLVVLSFVLGGLNCFFLAYYITRSYAGSLLAGFIFTFSSYHFAHLGGHLNLLGLQWIPLFALSWYALLRKPGLLVALAASLSLLLCTMTDYYYAFYCVLLGVVMLVAMAIRQRRAAFFLAPPYLAPLSIFAMATVLTSGLIIGALLRANANDPFIGAHVSREFSLDLLAPVIHGGHWRFSSFTEPHWSSVGLKFDESSAHLGVSVMLLLGLVLMRRRSLEFPGIWAWFFLLFAFTVLSFGPELQVWGHHLSWVKLPYALMEKAIPGLQLSGVPGRMIVIAFLAAALIASVGFAALLRAGWLGRTAALLLAVMLVFEYLPSNPRELPEPIWALEIPVPAYVQELKQLPEGGGVLDLTTRSDLELYYQTVHEKPLASGFLSRVPTSLAAIDGTLRWLADQGEYRTLQSRYQVKYLVTAYEICEAGEEGCASVVKVYQDSDRLIYDLDRTIASASNGDR